MTTTRISESVYSDATLRVDRDAKVIRGVKIIGRESLNGREYSDKALDQAAKLYEGADVFIDHDRGDRERSITESPAVLRGVKREKDGVRGDLHYLESHPYTPQLLERAERFPETFGLSHDASGTVGNAKNGRVVVESIESVNSVDIVKKPATNKGLFESKERTVKKTVKQIAEQHKAAKNGGKLAKLLEESELAPMGAGELEMPETATPDESADAAIESMVLAVFRSGDDAKTKLAKIKKILGVADELNGAVSGEGSPVDSPMTESAVKKMISDGIAAALKENREKPRVGSKLHESVGDDADASYEDLRKANPLRR